MSKYFLVCIVLFFSGCGDKLIKMNNFENITYSYHPHANSQLEEETEELISDDKKINSLIEKSNEELKSQITFSLDSIYSNQNNQNIMESPKKNYHNASSPNKLFKDRFDELRIAQ